jgi:GntR family transcriptional regulator
LVDKDTHVQIPLDRARSATSAVDDGRERVTYRPLSLLVARPSSGIAERLELTDQEEVVFLERLTSLDDFPFTLSSIWIPRKFATGLIGAGAHLEEGVIDIIRRCPGVELGVSQYSIEATSADQAVAGLLQVPVSSPLLLLVALNHLVDGRPIALQYVRGRSDRLRYEVPAVRPSECGVAPE